MKLTINKKQFLGSWSLAERSTSTGGTVSILSSILVKASAESVILQATDIKTSVICRAAGVTVLEPGEAVFPIKMVSDLFKKAPGEEFTLDVDGGKVVLRAGRSKYNFSTYPVGEFPALPSSDEAELFCSIAAGELAKVLDEGTLAASAGEEFPLYLSSANLQIVSSRLNVVSTDTRRLALSAASVFDAKEGEQALLPMKGIKELQRILGSLTPETEVKVLFDSAQFYFKTETLEFTVRRVESKFPPYEKILPKHSTLDVLTDRGELISALERVDVIVRDFNRMVVLDMAPDGPVVLRGKAPDFGQAKEEIEAEIKGDKLRIAVNSKFFLEALKVLREPQVRLSFNGQSGHMSVKRGDGDGFLCLIAPINLSEDELKAFDSDLG
ncbi:DNA polymerase III subunit beta [Cloacibacillus sp. An23]|uniref:DNA polymerase III subunit beta n=1 Tax=Cloacibacillus sp. An23 TaxID=1965591 RepID=UPI000B39DD6B|nr:DNA polymerase III subunit beta [Cloacibacillus sp. An23]OUO93214.1 DNA polymerase III subunit beta [Cloacibacillus sp. An23]